MRRLFGVLMLIASIVMTIALVIPAAANGTMTISSKALNDHECDSTEWHFVINQVDSEADAPATIHVIWANGASEDVPMWKFTGGVAHYVTTSNLDSVVTQATAEIYDTWSGEFNLSHGPCGQPPTPTNTVIPPTPTTPPGPTPTNTVIPPTPTTPPGPTPTTPGPTPTPPGPTPTTIPPIPTVTTPPIIPPNTAGSGSPSGSKGILWTLDVVMGLFGLGLTFIPGTRKVAKK